MGQHSLQHMYDAYQRVHDAQQAERRRAGVRLTALQRHLGITPGAERSAHQNEVSQSSGFKRIAQCRKALEALDRRGWNRSFHQREFHDHFIRACARIFWKTEKPGAFARDHQRILESNGWSSLRQEVLISTPRRFGKTISVSMFAAAMLYSTPNLEMSIYSTCKRISQKLLRNVYKFLDLIYQELGVKKMKEIRFNFEEIVLKGPESDQDVRVVNSYPSKVTRPRARPARVILVKASLPPRLLEVRGGDGVDLAQLGQLVGLEEALFEHVLARLLKSLDRLGLPEEVGFHVISDGLYDPGEGSLRDPHALLAPMDLLGVRGSLLDRRRRLAPIGVGRGYKGVGGVGRGRHLCWTGAPAL